ncbi:hypothetical protein AVEN_94013-1 [Araneus ventricosus]|uniref:Uncharacterized protein n=1 Tax=Araneus ventricosus TaxID=182803 RepID=A0A4Y2T0W2_ARAVE|nr:hypothetical protein AVEN_94013-1 [Araneus ventricosus]
MCAKRLAKKLDSGTHQAEVHNKQKFKTGKTHTADRSKQQAEVHNSQKSTTGRSIQQAEITQQAEVHSRQKSTAGRNIGPRAGRKLQNSKKHLVSRSVLQNPPFVMLSPSQQKGETSIL